MYIDKRERVRRVGEGDRKRKVEREGGREGDARPHPGNTMILLKVKYSIIFRASFLSYYQLTTTKS